MFESLTDKLSGVFDELTKRGALKEADVDVALREVRVALLDADVALSVAKDFIANVRVRAVGADVLKSVTPGQMVIKIVHDELVNTLGDGDHNVNLAGTPPVAILMVGLQGSGKTTTSAKLGLRLTSREKRRSDGFTGHLSACGTTAVGDLGMQTGVTCLPSVLGEQPVAIAKRAMQMARLARRCRWRLRCGYPGYGWQAAR